MNTRNARRYPLLSASGVLERGQVIFSKKDQNEQDIQSRYVWKKERIFDRNLISPIVKMFDGYLKK